MRTWNEDTVSRHLNVTARADLRKGAGANTHFCFDPSVYTKHDVPNHHIVTSLEGLGVGMIRERAWPGDTGQRTAFADVSRAGIGLYLFVGTVSSSKKAVAADVEALARASYASSIVALCGPNEPNAGGGNNWPRRVVAVQKAIYTEAHKYAAFRKTAIVGPALMHNNTNIERDYRALRAAGVERWCDAGDFHYYPGAAGPVRNAAEAKRARLAYGNLALWHSETGWTGADTDPATAGRFTVEAFLRNHLTGMVGTMVYELADESQNVAGREGLFGMMTPTRPKPAYTEVKSLLGVHDGKQPAQGWLVIGSRGGESDTGVVVTSEGGSRWTIYLLREKDRSVTLVLPASLAIERRSTQSLRGDKHYNLDLTKSMEIVKVRAA